MLVFGLLVREAELEHRGRTLGGADRQYQGAVTVGGIAVGPQPPLFDENLHDTGKFVNPRGPLGSAFGHRADLGWDVTGVPGNELLRRHGLPPRDHGDDDPLGEIIYVSATLA
jgi:hypothetical protein